MDAAGFAAIPKGIKRQSSLCLQIPAASFIDAIDRRGFQTIKFNPRLPLKRAR
jgi:hypothetical protein